MYRFFYFFLALLIPIILEGKSITLLTGLKNSTPGEYIVICQDKMATLFRIAEKREKSILFEEISIPCRTYVNMGISFRQWYENGAECNTSWTVSEINSENGSMLRSYSFTRQKWLQTETLDSFLSTLLTLSFEEISPEQRKRIGTAPGYGKPDLRPLWHPCFCCEGEPLAVSFDAYSATWPSDGSELSKRKIVIYLPSSSTYPTFLPYLLEVEGWKIGHHKIQVMDCGTSLFSSCCLPF